MVKASDLLGRAVVSREGGRGLGRVKDVVVDHSGKQMLGIVVSEPFLRSARVALWASVLAVGPHSVVLDTARSVVDSADAPEIKSVLDKGTRIRGLTLQTTAGKEIGRIEDLQFDEESGLVLGYELSGGVFADTLGGRPFLPSPSAIELGEDIAFVSPEVEATIQEPTGGIKGAFRREKSSSEGVETARASADAGAAPSQQPPQQG